METFLAVIHIIACFGLVGLVLIQDSKGGGVFTSQAGSNSVLGATGATTLAQTMTKIVAVIFALTCITLSIMAARSGKSVIDSGISPTVTPAGQAAPMTAPVGGAAPQDTAPSATNPSAPAAPAAGNRTVPATQPAATDQKK